MKRIYISNYAFYPPPPPPPPPPPTGSTTRDATPPPTQSPEPFSSSSSASRRKLAQTVSLVPDSDLLLNISSLEETVDLMGGLATPFGFRFIDMSISHTASSWLRYPYCTAVDSLGLLEGTERQGVASKLLIRCCECNHTSTFCLFLRVVENKNAFSGHNKT